jgi:DNA polymerase delta subunit 1
LDRLLLAFDKDQAVEFCKGMISDLLQNRIDLSLLVITKGLSKKVGDGDNEKGDEGEGAGKNAVYTSN